MEKAPEHINFVKRHPLKETFDEFDVWLRKIEDTIPDEEELEEVIAKCKQHYGEEFNEIFDIEKIGLLHENHLDWCLWDLQQSLKYD